MKLNNKNLEVLAEIDKKIAKNKSIIEKKNNLKIDRPTLVIFDFFKRMESCISQDGSYIPELARHTITALSNDLKKIDWQCHFKVHFSKTKHIEGVTINWGTLYTESNKCEKTLYIGVDEYILN
jgi:hypothetical protein